MQRETEACGARRIGSSPSSPFASGRCDLGRNAAKCLKVKVTTFPAILTDAVLASRFARSLISPVANIVLTFRGPSANHSHRRPSLKVHHSPTATQQHHIQPPSFR